MPDRERWRTVSGWPGYKVSSNGRVRSRRCVLRPTPDKDGYLYVTLRDGARSRRVHVAVLVLEVFDRPRPAGMEACHGPQARGRDDCRLIVLRWGTHQENERDKWERERLDGRDVIASPPDTPVASVTFPSDPVSLAEAAALGVVACSFSGLRMARFRLPDFPASVGNRGRALLYNARDLHAWDRRRRGVDV